MKPSFAVAAALRARSGLTDWLRPRSLHEGELRAYQLRRINRLVAMARADSPFYREFYREAGVPEGFRLERLEDLSRLPILTKERFKAAVKLGTIGSTRFDPASLISAETTGSTGDPIRVFVEAEGARRRQVALDRMWRGMGAHPYRRIARVWRSKSLSAREMRLRKLGLFLPVEVGDVSSPLETASGGGALESTVRELLEFDPEVIRGYVSALFSIARALEARGGRLKSLRSVIASAEYLPEHVWEELERAFGCRVHNLYGGTEAPSVACTLEDRRELTLAEDLYFTEVLDVKGGPVGAGQPGNITLTDLAADALPLIRYQIGDLATVDEGFAHDLGPGFRRLKSVEGRTDDVFVLEDGSIVFAHVWYVYFRNQPWIDRFKVVQNSTREVDVLILPAHNGSGVPQDQLGRLRDEVEGRFPGLSFRWNLVDAMPLDAGQKFRAVVSRVRSPFNQLAR